MWPTAIIVINPSPKDPAEVRLVERDHEIQTLSTDRADQPLAERVHLWCANRRFEHRHSDRRKRPIDTLGVNRVSVVDHQSVRLVAHDDHAKLLRGPLGVFRGTPISAANSCCETSAARRSSRSAVMA